MILRLRVENWTNKESFDVKFKEGCNLIFGPNYSGKSSLLNAIFYSLTGTLPNELTPGIMVRKGVKEATIEIDFKDSKGKIYRIRRSIKTGRRKGDAHLYLLVGGGEWEEVVSGDKEVAEEILNRLGSGPNYLLRAIFMREGDIYRFLAKPEKGLQEEFTKILGIDRITHIAKELSRLGRDMKKEMTNLENKIWDVKEKVGGENTQNLEKKLGEIEKKIEELDRELVDKQEKRRKIDEKLSLTKKLEKLDLRIEELKGKMQNIIGDIPGDSNYMERLENLLKRKKSQLEDLKRKVDNLILDLKGLEIRVENLRAEIEKLGEVVMVCPLCERPMTKEEAKIVIGKKEKRITQLKIDISERQDTLKVKKRELHELEMEIDRLTRKKNDMEKVFEEIRSVNEERNVLRSMVCERREKIEKELYDINNQIENKKMERDKLLMEKGMVEEKIRASEVEIDKLEQKLRDLAHKHYVTSLFVKACEDTAEEISKSVLNRVKWEAANIWEKVRGGVWEVDWDKRLIPLLRRGDEEYLAEQLSGAEKIVLFIAMRIALAKHMGNPGFLVLDEPFEHLDEKNKNFLGEILLKLPGNGVGQLIVASCDEQSLSVKWDNITKLSS